MNNISLPPDNAPKKLGFDAPIVLGDANFTQIPNFVINKVINGGLKSQDLLTYSYLKAATRGLGYAIQPISSLCLALKAKETAVKGSLSRLCEAGVIRRQKTLRITKTFILMDVAKQDAGLVPRGEDSSAGRAA